MTEHTDIVVIGAGQAGLATSRCLADAGIDHIVLERGRVAQRWRSERWNSLRLLTPNWMTRLPGFRYSGPDPDGFMSTAELAGMMDCYAANSRAPVIEGADVLSVAWRRGRYLVGSTRGDWTSRGVVLSTGHCDRPAVPDLAASLPRTVVQVTPAGYRRPADLPEGGVLVVGASATGVQLAEELHLSGRPVTLAVGRHVRLPRRYRGRDIMWWLDRTGILDEPAPHPSHGGAASPGTSLQLVGSPEGRDIDLGTLGTLGVRLAGRLQGVGGGRVSFGAGLPDEAARADSRMRRVLDRINAWAQSQGLADLPADDIPPVWPEPGPEEVDIASAGIRSVVWATGYRRDYSWLHLPVLDRHGEIANEGGVTPLPGLYVIGTPFQSCRKSTFVDGVGADAVSIVGHVRSSLLRSRSAA